ncbi:hypothetical protein CMQ_4677 [Grosmannia clavigera kw1407]|uniref:Uncharacterized protein n=1 Tax=Grosmannia clavigera (strain kw1407 / UAMH 11150) TaxID=655863 RepID=F0XUK2_GROCL|nr:uncharacterized protein CMQ_4677 [Grosmannia clavigera kw1407]EFW98825.1 hypothetical protein CMQ_4677 [Grosmannia clavigera kw1407]
MYANIVLFTGLVGCAAATSSSLPYSEETQSSAAFASPTSEACAIALAELISKMESYISSYDTKVTNTAACWLTIPSTFDSIYSSYIEFSYSTL